MILGCVDAGIPLIDLANAVNVSSKPVLLGNFVSMFCVNILDPTFMERAPEAVYVFCYDKVQSIFGMMGIAPGAESILKL